jgi:predicted transcriptional regulator
VSSPLYGETKFSAESDSLIAVDKTPQPGRKSQVQIRFEILEFLFYDAGAHSRTSLWRRATQLSYDDFQKYLEYLKSRGFVEESDEGIRLATAGKDVYLKLRDTLPSLL